MLTVNWAGSLNWAQRIFKNDNVKKNDKIYVRPDKASLAFDFGILRNAGVLSLLTSIIVLIVR